MIKMNMYPSELGETNSNWKTKNKKLISKYASCSCFSMLSYKYYTEKTNHESKHRKTPSPKKIYRLLRDTEMLLGITHYKINAN